MNHNNRIVSYITLYIVAALLLHVPLAAISVQDATRLSSGNIAQQVTPQSVDELYEILQRVPRPVAVAGAGYSQGGQAWVNHGTVVDMSYLNRIRDVDIARKKITVEAGATWRHVQEVLNPIGLSPHVMQSYNDFSIGGSLSVNAHGRNTTGSIIKTVDCVTVLLPSGNIVSASRTHNPDLFYAVIGGYGSCGVILEATIHVVDNVAMRCEAQSMHIDEYLPYLQHRVISNPEVILHNANLYPKDFTQLLAVNWVVDTPYRIERSTNLVRPDSHHIIDTYGELIVRRWWGGQYLRQKLEPHISSQAHIRHRNYEIGKPVATLGPWTQILSSNILQEYFIPCDQLTSFIALLRDIRNMYGINVLNASLRYVPADDEAVLSYAPQDCCSVVLYINIMRTQDAFDRAKQWTQELIEAALRCNGTYYLPYHLFASHDQFRRAYPQWHKLLDIKRAYDPRVFSCLTA